MPETEPKTTWTKEEFWAELESLGEDKVRLKFATGSWSDNIRSGLVTLWLKSKDDNLRLNESSRREARESFAIRLAIWANIIAVIAIAIASKEQIALAILYILNLFS